MRIGVEDGGPSVARSAAAFWAFEKEEKEDEAEDVPFHKQVEGGPELTDDEIGIKEHQDDDSAGRGGARGLGGGRRRSSTGDGDGDRDGISDLRSSWAKISLAISPDFRYSATDMFWDYATFIFGLSRRG